MTSGNKFCQCPDQFALRTTDEILLASACPSGRFAAGFFDFVFTAFIRLKSRSQSAPDCLKRKYNVIYPTVAVAEASPGVRDSEVGGAKLRGF